MRLGFAISMMLLLALSDASLAARGPGNPGQGHGRNTGAGAAACDAARCAVQAALDQSCPCSPAANHGSYVRCVGQTLRRLAASGTIPPRCTGRILRCAAQSTCGKSGFVTCQRPASGVCKLVSSAASCQAAGGTLGTSSTCCAACTTSTTVSSTTTTTLH